MKKIKINWEDFVGDILYIGKEIGRRINKKTGEFDKIKNIYAIPRGGLIVGTILSHHLELPMIFDSSKITKNTLVVDDINDTGETLQRIVGKTKAKTVVVVENKDSKFKTDFFARYKEENWIVFPFETYKSSKYDRTV